MKRNNFYNYFNNELYFRSADDIFKLIIKLKLQKIH